MKNLIPIDVRQDRIEILLAALKVAESHYTVNNHWDAADLVSKLHTSLYKQIFEYEQI